MRSTYQGLYVQRYDNGQIHNVQVTSPGGASIPLDPDDYVARGIEPPMEELPDAAEYFKQRQKQDSPK
jgi:hypothetical protein